MTQYSQLQEMSLGTVNELPRSPDERDFRSAPTSYGVSIGSYLNASRGGELVRLRRIKPLSASGGLNRLDFPHDHKFDEFVKSRKFTFIVIPADPGSSPGGIQYFQ